MNSINAGSEFFLSKVSYLEERKEIIAEFSSPNGKTLERFRFFPKAFFNCKGKSIEIVMEILRLYDAKRFKASEARQGILEIQASTFTDLKKISKLLQQSFGNGLRLVEPERQFLLEKEWNYFDAFKEFNFGMQKSKTRGIPEASIEYCNDSFEKTASQLARHDIKAAESFLESFALSKELCIPMQSVPELSAQKASLFLQNSFFKNSYSQENETREKTESFEENASSFFQNISSRGLENFQKNSFFENVSEIDFTPTWAGWLFSSNSCNLGFETINCNCCRPEGINAENILPNSMIEAKFLQNGFYYASQNPEFALEFHNSNGNKKARVQRMNEWFLNNIPTGPFNAGEKALIPLNDALMLEKTGKAEILGKSSLEWFCKNKKSFISNEIQTLILKITRTEDRLLESEHNALKAHKVLCSGQLSQNPEYLALYFEKKALEKLLKAVLKELSNPSSECYSSRLGKALKAVQNSKISEFKQLAKQSFGKILSANNNTVLLQAENPSILIKEFAQKAKTPRPEISRNYRQLVLA
jgi:hypothetical protein